MANHPEVKPRSAHQQAGIINRYYTDLNRSPKGLRLFFVVF